MKIRVCNRDIELSQGDEIVFNGKEYFLVSQGYITSEGYVHPRLKRDICDELVRNGTLSVKLTRGEFTRYNFHEKI